MEDPISRLQHAQQTFLETVEKFPQDRREEILFGRWSLKNVLAHMAAWNLYTIQCLEDLQAGKEPPFNLRVNQFNSQEIKRRKSWGFEKVLEELKSSSEALTASYRRLPTELWDQKFWAQRKWTPRKFLAVDIKHYQKDHLFEIQEKLSK